MTSLHNPSRNTGCIYCRTDCTHKEKTYKIAGKFGAAYILYFIVN